MINSLLTVVTPASSYDLVSLAVLKDELQVRDRKSDARLRRWLTQASDQVAKKIDRVIGSETVSEVWRLGSRGSDRFFSPHYSHAGGRLSGARPLELARRPVTSIGSVTIGDTVLDADDYEVDADVGFLWRLEGTCRASWYGDPITVVYTGGYVLPDDPKLPSDLAEACLLILRHRWMTGDRDPTIKSENVPGVLETTYWVGGIGEDASMPPEALALLEPYRTIRF